MTDYIERKAAIHVAEKYGLANGTTIGRHSGIAEWIERELEALPAADVKPVRHVAWKPMVDPCGKIEGWICECGRKSKEMSKFCPDCGAKMDGRK